jgi:hypothetical protein
MVCYPAYLNLQVSSNCIKTVEYFIFLSVFFFSVLYISTVDLGPVGLHVFEHATTKNSNVCERLVKDLGDVRVWLSFISNFSILSIYPYPPSLSGTM